MSLKAPYLLALCDVVPPGVLGVAARLGTQSSIFNLDAARLIRSIVRFSPATESVAIEFLGELRKSSRLHQLGWYSYVRRFSLRLKEQQLNQCCLAGLNHPTLNNGPKPYWTPSTNLPHDSVLLSSSLSSTLPLNTYLIFYSLVCLYRGFICDFRCFVFQQFVIRVAKRHHRPRSCPHRKQSKTSSVLRT
jgi:hypothetical protein